MQPAQGVVLEQRTLRTLQASQARFMGGSDETSTDMLSFVGNEQNGGRQ